MYGDFILKYSYFAKSSRYLFFGSLALFITKLAFVLSAFSGSASERLQSFFSSPTEVAFYGFLILSFVALYNEGTAHKRSRDFRSVKSVSYLKKLTVYCILSVFVKAIVKGIAKSIPETGALGVSLRAVCALFVSATSLSFLMFAISLWCFKRDRSEKALLLFEIIALAVGIIYFASRYVSVLSEFGVSFLNAGTYERICGEGVQGILCIVQYGADALLFYMTHSYFAGLDGFDVKALSEAGADVCKGESLYNECGYGLDELDNLYLPSFSEEAQTEE